jgi:hypothetical protein
MISLLQRLFGAGRAAGPGASPTSNGSRLDASAALLKRSLDPTLTAATGLEVVLQLLDAGLHQAAADAAKALRGRFALNADLFTLHARCLLALGEVEQAADVVFNKLQALDLYDYDTVVVKALLGNRSEQGGALRASLLGTPRIKELLCRSNMGRFESLGQNCEFGFVQRRFGHEPLGLFRWGTMPLEQMIRLFDVDFEGFGLAESSRLKLHINPDTDHREYRFCDDAFQYEVHTYQDDMVLGETGVGDALLKKSLLHAQFLARVLRETLLSADKVCVYMNPKPVDLSEAQALLAALRRLGNNRLLVVTDGHNSAEPVITHRSEHLLMGRIEEFNVYQPPLAAWSALIAEASRHFFPEVLW